MKSRREIWLCALEELGARCSVRTARDAETLARRTAREGDEFLLITLPAFAKDLERSLDIGHIPTDAFVGFKRRVRHVAVMQDDTGFTKHKKVSGGNPLFLGGFLDLLFCDEPELTEDEWYTVEAISDRHGQPAAATLPPTLHLFDEMDDDAQARAASAVHAIRQLCLMFAKEEELCSDSRVNAAISSYEKTDQELELPF